MPNCSKVANVGRVVGVVSLHKESCMRTKCEGDVSFGGLGLEGVDRGMCIERAARVL